MSSESQQLAIHNMNIMATAMCLCQSAAMANQLMDLKKYFKVVALFLAGFTPAMGQEGYSQCFEYGLVQLPIGKKWHQFLRVHVIAQNCTRYMYSQKNWSVYNQN